MRCLRLVVGLVLFVLSTQGLPADCRKIGERCVEPGGPRTFEGVVVEQPCWRWRADYECVGNQLTSEPSCQAYLDQGCSFVGRQCTATGCVLTYRCQTTQGTSTPALDCSQQSWNVGNLQFDSSYPPNRDFGRVAAQLAAVDRAGGSATDPNCTQDPANPGQYLCDGVVEVFSGQDLRCEKSPLGFKDCCSISGWGTANGLAQCSSDEQRLAQAREAGQCHYVGSYCARTALFGLVCESERFTYCCFGGKLGRIVQEQGRNQLGLGWGNAEAPLCVGFTTAQLQQLDFDQIDFSDFFADALNAAGGAAQPSQEVVNQRVQEYLNRVNGGAAP